jgi:hypothetical protein
LFLLLFCGGMTHPLDGVRLKLVRAKKHLDEVMRELSLLEEGECRLIPERNEDLGLLVQRIYIAPKPSLELSAAIGDFLFGVKSALDHLVWQLVIRNGREPNGKNMFPIAACLCSFGKAVTMRGQLKGVAGKAHALIESLQPYYGGNEPLGRLNTLHNTDKHRTLNLTTVVADKTSLSFAGRSVFMNLFLIDEDLRDGAIFGDTGMPLNDPEFNAMFPSAIERASEMEVEGKASLFVAFDEPAADSLEGFRVDRTLQEILEFARETIIPAFEPFFD